MENYFESITKMNENVSSPLNELLVKYQSKEAMNRYVYVLEKTFYFVWEISGQYADNLFMPLPDDVNHSRFITLHSINYLWGSFESIHDLQATNYLIIFFLYDAWLPSLLFPTVNEMSLSSSHDLLITH